LAQTRDELCSATEAVDSEEMGWRCGRVEGGQGGVVGPAHGDSGVEPVREPDDQIGVRAAADTDDLHPLATQRVMRVGDGDKSRRRLGSWGSVLSISQP